MKIEAKKSRNYKEDFKRDAVAQRIPSPFKSGTEWLYCCNPDLPGNTGKDRNGRLRKYWIPHQRGFLSLGIAGPGWFPPVGESWKPWAASTGN